MTFVMKERPFLHKHFVLGIFRQLLGSEAVNIESWNFNWECTITNKEKSKSFSSISLFENWHYRHEVVNTFFLLSISIIGTQIQLRKKSKDSAHFHCYFFSEERFKWSKRVTNFVYQLQTAKWSYTVHFLVKQCIKILSF